MWMIELNILGRRFTREVPVARDTFKIDPRLVQARLAQFRRPGAAA
jgi:hypothetical protein